MQRRWLVVLALAAGCGSGGPAASPDAARDAAKDAVSDAVPNDVTAAPDAQVDSGQTHADGGADIVNRVDSGADRLPDGGAGTDVHADRPPDALQSLCPAQITTVTLDSGPVNGTLKTGVANNPAVSCHGGVPTQGPDAFFTLTLAEPGTVDIVVAAPVDTLIALRPGPCKDSISELSCGEDPPKVDADGGVPLPTTNDAGLPLRLTGLRTPLAAGTYTIVVDSYTLGNLPSAPFTMTLSRVQPRPNASCAAPTLISSGTTVTAEPLDLGGAPAPVCGNGNQTSLYYSVGVPPGQRLTVRATPATGDRAWMPRIEAFAACSSSACLAQGHLSAGTTQQLDWINNGAAWQLIDLAVGSDSAVSGATFDLTVTVVDLFATCARPMTVKDGTTLLGQDLSLATAATSGQTCSGVTDHAFYYAATLLPLQQISVNTSASGATSFFSPPIVNIRQSCVAALCTGDGQSATFTNQTNADQTVLIEVTSQQFNATSLFDLVVSMPPPPAGIAVTPTGDLVTTESGGTATFTVALTSPPTSDVTIGVASNTPSEGTASPATLLFTSTNWRTPQTVTVTGIDDQVADGPRDYIIVTSAATSSDTRYAGLNPEDVGVTNLDNDPGVSFTGAGDVVTSEAGMTSSFKVTLNAAPTASVTVPLTSSDIGEATVSPAQLTFTAANWNVPQVVTVTGVDDAEVDGTQSYKILTGTLTSGDARYAGQNPPDVSARNLDDDQVAVGVKLVSGAHSCSFNGQTVPIAIDHGGQLYIAMQCDNGLWITTSNDGGVTFTEATLIAGTDNIGGSVSLAAGAPGFAYVAYGANDGTAQFARTIDGGATWSTPVLLAAHNDFIHLAAAEKTVLVVTPFGINAVTLARSVNGGRDFQTSQQLNSSNFDVAVGPDGQTAWLLDLQNSETLSKSTDAGATFTKVADLNVDVQAHVVGTSKLFAMSSPLQIISLADPTNVVSSVDFINLPGFSMAVDDVDGLTILDTDPDQGRLRATHVLPSGPAPTSGRIVGPGPGAAGTVALSRKASAIAFISGNIVLYSTIVW